MSRPFRTRFAAIAAIVGTLIVGGLAGVATPAAFAKDYPTWDDVANARNNEAATQAKIGEIQALLGGLKAEAERTAADAKAKGEVWAAADQRFQEQAYKTANLQKQADAADLTATQSEQQAGQWAAQLMRGGGQDLTANLLVSGDADNLLYGLGMSSKISDQAYAIYERALLDRNTAQSLSDSAEVARAELEVLKLKAEKLFIEAQTASNAAAAALAEQQKNEATLQQQLVVLTERRAATEADYQAGVKERFGSGANLDVGEISATGWVKPVSGPITDNFGPRIPPTGGASSYHQGTDIGAGCGQKIYAATAGTIVYAGWNGSYGNFVLIDHGGGVQTAYGHIVDGGILVGYGQHVDIGQNIALVGTTGASTGCHLHLEVRINGGAIDAVPFFAGQGISIG